MVCAAALSQTVSWKAVRFQKKKNTSTPLHSVVGRCSFTRFYRKILIFPQTEMSPNVYVEQMYTQWAPLFSSYFKAHSVLLMIRNDNINTRHVMLSTVCDRVRQKSNERDEEEVVGGIKACGLQVLLCWIKSWLTGSLSRFTFLFPLYFCDFLLFYLASTR